MISYLFTKEEFAYIASLVNKNGNVPVKYCTFVTSFRLEKVVQSLFQKGFITSLDPPEADPAVYFIIRQMTEAVKYMMTSGDEATVFYAERCIIIIEDDLHLKNGVKLTALENMDALDEYLEEREYSPGKCYDHSDVLNVY